MALELIPPGKRVKKAKDGTLYPNKVYLVRGSVGGVDREFSTKTVDPILAKKFMLALELKLMEKQEPGARADITWAEGADLYVAFRNPAKADRKRIDKLKASPLAKKFVTQIEQDDLVAEANRRYGLATGEERFDPHAEAKNREVMTPATTVLHYCARTKRCAWLRVEQFKEPRPVTRGVAKPVAAALVVNLPLFVGHDGTAHHRLPAKLGCRDATPKDLARLEQRQRMKRLLLLWLFHQGNRISDALRIEWTDEAGERKIDLAHGLVRYRTGKTQSDREKPLHPEVFEHLAMIPEAERAGRLFPWKSRHSVYKWLRPYVKKLGITFTPHMARHSLGKWLNEGNVSLRGIMDALDHDDESSSVRYQSTGVEALRDAQERQGKLGGGKG